MPLLVINVGLPASGKSTFTKKNYSPEDYSVINFDAYIGEEDETYQDALKKIDHHHIMASIYKEFTSLIADNKDIVIDMTNLTTYARARWLSNVPENYEKVAVYFPVRFEVIQERNIIREKEQGKYIPDHVLRKMYDDLEIPITSEGFDSVFTIECEK